MILRNRCTIRFMKKLFAVFSLVWGVCLAQGATRPVLLTWSASPSSGVTGYNVYRSTVSGSGYVKIGNTTTALTFTDSTANIASQYFYVVTATGQACTPTLPAGTGCGESPNSPEAAVLVPARTSQPGSIVVVIQ